MITTEWGTFADELTPGETIMWKGDDQARLRSGGPLLLLLDRTPDWDRLNATFERLSRLYPRLRQRIVTTPFGLSRPRWTVDDDFDLAYHLRRLAIPEPETVEHLLELIAPDASAGFDPIRPPWIGTLFEGLDDGRAALVLRHHHALFDGRGMIQMFERGFDAGRKSKPVPDAAIPPARRTTEMDLLRTALAPRHLLAGTVQRMRAASAKGPVRPDVAVRDVGELGRALFQLVGSSAKDGSALLAPRSNSVVLGTLDVPFTDLRAAAKAAGGSINDALLAIVTDALDRYHRHLGAPVDSVNIAFPISIRALDDDSVGGNQFGGAMIAAPTGIAEPAARIARIRELVIDARDTAASKLVDALTSVLYRLPSWMIASVPLMAKVDAQVSNFPGLTERRYVGGAEVLAMYAFGPHPGTPMMIVLISHVGKCCIGVNADVAAITDMPAFISFIDQARADLLSLSGPRRRGSRS